MQEWSEGVLSDLVFFQRGFDITKAKQNEGSVPVVSSSGINSYHDTFKQKAPGIVIGRKGTLGSVFFIKENYWPHDTTLWSKEIKCNPLFAYYLLQTLSLAQYDVGNANPTLNRNHIHRLKVKYPDEETQKTIAEILSAYDDLIEKNLKQIKLLEELAQITYDEWFVRLRFPGHEATPTNPETELPEGWKKEKLKNYCLLISRGSSLNYELGNGEEGTPVLNQSCIRNGEIELQKVLYAKKLSTNKSHLYLKINDVLINSMGDGTLGRVSKNVSVDYDMIIHNCITVLRSKNEYSQYFLFYFTALHQTFFELIAHGSTGQSSLNKSLIENIEIKIPTKELFKKFDELVSPMWKAIGKLNHQNESLKEARNILLPRLITGMIDVKEYDLSKLLQEAA